jgi:DNA-binding GntR family transcriptional regulator
MEVLKSVKRNATLADQAYDTIRNAILANRLKPGELLTEEGCASMLQISRTPVREALRRLLYEKLAVEDGPKNIIVAGVTGQDVADITVVRRSIETLAVRLAAERGVRGERLELLEKLCSDYRQAVVAGDVSACIDLDYRFHVELAACSENLFLLDTVQNANFIVRRYLTLSGTMKKYSAVALDEHIAVVMALAQGNVLQAVAAMEQHLENVNARMLV